MSVSVSVSVLTLTFISIDRWYAICYPLKFKSTSGRAKVAILIIWITSMLLVLPDVIVLDTKLHPGLKVETHYLTDCAYTWSDDNTQIYQLVIVLILYVAPFALMSVTYYQIARVLWNKNIPGNRNVKRTVTVTQNTKKGTTRCTTNQDSIESQIRSRRKAAKMLIAVIVMFGLCYLPVHLINTLRYTIGLPQTHTTAAASLISHWLCYANSAVNPVIYNFMSGKFRREFRKSFCMLFTIQESEINSQTPTFRSLKK
ncbi:orexin receptor type 2-like [Centruroides sculpturatus]|uniref:orexin receptor type 2-like n=1 Tax=Centruroides sculpturatus TaxID=218467 RepID=UPI000C6D259F|nr:orexin receptor type 2-like [Centruroides sculpturatus]